MSGIKRTAADVRFSKMIRERDNYTCQRCGAGHLPNSRGLHSAHCFGRGTGPTRLDPDNALALCYGCHQYLDSHGPEKHEFFRKALGDERFTALEARARSRRDRRMAG